MTGCHCIEHYAWHIMCMHGVAFVDRPAWVTGSYLKAYRGICMESIGHGAPVLVVYPGISMLRIVYTSLSGSSTLILYIPVIAYIILLDVQLIRYCVPCTSTECSYRTMFNLAVTTVTVTNVHTRSDYFHCIHAAVYYSTIIIIMWQYLVQLLQYLIQNSLETQANWLATYLHDLSSTYIHSIICMAL